MRGAVQLLFSILLDESKDSLIILIDEPELSLHPQAQRKLFQLLVEEAKNKQIILSTHSSYFADPSYLGNILKFQKNEEGGIEVHSIKNEGLKSKIKENRNFFFRHRDLFFTSKAIFIEGVEDFDRYSKFCENNGFGDIIPHFYMMNGCGNTEFFKSLCAELGISFCAIVDIDYMEKDSETKRELTIKGLPQNNTKNFYRENFKNIEDIYKAHKEVLKKENIFLLPVPDVIYFLDSEGKPLDDYHKEVETIFKLMNA